MFLERVMVGFENRRKASRINFIADQYAKKNPFFCFVPQKVFKHVERILLPLPQFVNGQFPWPYGHLYCPVAREEVGLFERNP